MEEPRAIENIIRGRLVFEDGSVKLGGLDVIADKLRKINRLILVACGTAQYATQVGRYMLEEYAGIPTEVDYSSEFRYRNKPMSKDTLIIAISQSGETADTLAAIKKAKKNNLLTLGVVNVVGSSIAREVKAGVYTRSGPEIAVASTKAFTSQLIVMAMISIYLAKYKDKVLAANLIISYGKYTTYLHGATSDNYRNVMAPYLLQWQAILDAKNNGYKHYDFGGVAPEGDENHSWSGITKFKLGFGGKRFTYPDSYDIVFKSTLYRLYKLLRFINQAFR